MKFVDAVMKLCSEPVQVFEPLITTKKGSGAINLAITKLLGSYLILKQLHS